MLPLIFLQNHYRKFSHQLAPSLFGPLGLTAKLWLLMKFRCKTINCLVPAWALLQALATWKNSTNFIFPWQELLLFAHSHIILNLQVTQNTLNKVGQSQKVNFYKQCITYINLLTQSKKKKKYLKKLNSEATKWSFLSSICSCNFFENFFFPFIKQNWPQDIK